MIKCVIPLQGGWRLAIIVSCMTIHIADTSNISILSFSELACATSVPVDAKEGVTYANVFGFAFASTVDFF